MEVLYILMDEIHLSMMDGYGNGAKIKLIGA